MVIIIRILNVKNIRNEIKQNLLNELEERCYMIKTAYYLER